MLVLVACLGATSSIAAQEPGPQAIGDEQVSLRLALTVYAAGAAADLYTTHQALRRDGFRELNPVGSWLDDRPTTMVVFSAAVDTAVVWSLHRWLAPRHSRLMRAGLYGAAGLRFWLAARNASAVRAYDLQSARGR